MLSILLLLACLSKSYSTQESLLMCNLRAITNISGLFDISNDNILEFLFYHLSNDNNEYNLVPIHSSDISIKDLFSKEDSLFAVGKVKEFLFAGVYLRSTSDIIMIQNLTTYLSEQTINNITKFSNPSIFKINFEIMNLISSLRSLSEDFNYTKNEKSITEQKIQEFKQKYLDDNYMLQYDDDSYKKLIVFDRFLHFIKARGINNEHFLFLKVEHGNSLPFLHKINCSINGFFSIGIQSSLFDIKANQINVFQLIQNCNSLAKYLLISLLLLNPLKNYIENKITSRWNVQYFYTFFYELTFNILLKNFIQYTYNIELPKKTYLALCFFYMLRYHFLCNSLKQLLQEILEDKWFKKISYYIFVILASDLFIHCITFFFEEFDVPKLLIFQVSTFLIPQIISNIYNKNIHNSMDMCLILLSYLRLYEIKYYFITMTNIYEHAFITAFILISLQSLLLFIQNKPYYMRLIEKIQETELPLNNDICSICLSSMNPSSGDCIVTSCRHMFHKRCLQRWVKEKMVCPICRTELPKLHTIYHLL